MIYFTSDLHLNCNREFIWKPRGFQSIDEMNSAIISNITSIIKPGDELYILGDLTLGQETGITEQLFAWFTNNNIKVTIIRGNHDTDNRVNLYRSFGLEVCDAKYLKYKGYHFFLTHYPCLTGNLERESLKQMTCNLFGHTHQKNNFYEDRPYMYHVGVDSHNCFPISIDKIIEDMNIQVDTCKRFL